MILKGYPRISETFISAEILLLESLGIPIEIYSLRQPRENFTHENVRNIKARVTYVPEYVLPNWSELLSTNCELFGRIGPLYAKCFFRAVLRAFERKSPATLRHFLQAGHLASTRLLGRPVSHLHAHFCHTPTSVALFASELTGLPFSFTAHAKDIYTSPPDQLARKISRASFVVTCTGYNATYLSKIRDRAGSKTPIHTIYHGIDLDFFSFAERSPAPSAPPYLILSVGRLVAKKGYDDLLRALKLLDDTGVEFELVQIGSGEIESTIRNMVGELGLGHRVKMLGTLTRREVVEWYRRADCFALSCKVASNGDRDGIPNVLVEAMAIGLPVVATRVSAIPELVEDGVTGTLVEPENPSAMARAISHVLLHPKMHAKEVLGARARVEKDFNHKNCVKRLYQLLDSAIGEKAL